MESFPFFLIEDWDAFLFWGGLYSSIECLTIYVLLGTQIIEQKNPA